MRWIWPIVVGISALGCKDPPSKPAETRAEGTSTPAAAVGGSAQARAHEGPTLPDETNSEDRAWADATAKAIAATAPDLENVTCAGQSCTATLAGDSEAVLATKSAALSADDSLRTTGAQSIKFGAPETKTGRVTLPVTILYER